MSEVFGTFATPSKTATAATAFAQLVPPWRGVAGGASKLYKLDSGRPNWSSRGAFTHITRLFYECGSTIHDVVVMRPLNYAIIRADVAHNAATFVLESDPGLYATVNNYKYGLPPEANGISASVANNAIAAGDYVAYQLRDGTWVLDTVASGTYAALVLTTSTPNVTGGGVEAGTPMFFFGIYTDKDPATGLIHPVYSCKASTRENLLGAGDGASISSLHPGDPMVVFSGNATAAGFLVTAAGHYADR
jgi:hypothetical protein